MGAKIFYFVSHTAAHEGNSGIQRVTRSLGRALAEIGCQVVYVSWLGASQRATRASDDELTRLARWNGPPFRPQSATGRPLEQDPADRDDLAGSWLVVPECPYYMSYDADAARALIDYAHRVGLKIAFIFYDLIPITMSGYEALRKLHVRYVQQLALADMIVPISRYSAVELERYFLQTLRLPRAELPQIIACPLPEEVPGHPRGRAGGEPHGDTIDIFSLGSVEPRKNQYKLLRAFDRLCAARPDLDMRLTLIGNHDRRMLQRLKRTLLRNPKVAFLGFLPDEEVIARYRGCHFTAFPSVEEGFGLPIAESLWFGKPCLCAEFGAMAEVAAGGGCLTLDTRSVGALQAGLERLSTDRALRRELAEQAAERPMRSWRDYAQDVLDALDRHAGFRDAFYWVDFTVHHPVNTGCQRVNRGLARALEARGVALEFVRWDYGEHRFAPLDEAQQRHLAGWNGPADRRIKPLSGDHMGRWLIVPDILSPPQPAAERVIAHAQSLGMKTAFIFYDTIPWKMRELYPPEFVQGFVDCWDMMREADVILPISRAAGHDLAEHYGRAMPEAPIEDGLIVSCPLPAELTERRRTHRTRAREGTRTSILCVGTIEPRKNQVLLAETFGALCKAGEADGMTLTFVGASGFYPQVAAELRQRIADLSNVTYLDYVDDQTLQALYEDCDFTVYASYEEGFGLPIVESLWNARPCLCHNAGAIAEISGSGGCHAVDMRDVAALRAGILRLARDRALYDRLAAEAVSRPLKTWSDYAGEVAGILAQRMGRPTQRVQTLAGLKPPTLWARLPHPAVICAELLERARGLFASRIVVRK